MKKLAILAAATLTAVLAAQAGEARELRIAPGAPPVHPSNGTLYVNFAKYIAEESNGDLTARVLGPEVVSLSQMKDALQSQLVEIGNLLPLYFPADLPNMSLAGELALAGREPQAMAAAMTEYIVTCETCQQELNRFGIVYLGSGSSDVYTLLTKKPVRTAADMKGLRLRSGGAPFSRFAEHFGAVPVSVAVNDTFESLSQGVIDGSMASIADLLSFRLIELVGSVSTLPLGTYHATSDFSVGNATWQSFSPEERAEVIRAANRANADFTYRWGYEMPDEARKAAKDAGLEIVEADPALLKEVQDFAQSDAKTVASLAKDRYGLADADQRVQRFLDLVDKWDKIVKETGPDPKAVAERVQAEVWDKVDPNAYGL
ncbi:C4-dicarboxylate TRAP transporter substrate-binding protein [Aurantimonas sp. VKM B-3413]|uniref:C4-dicarboxylate TRAP transporter substrate-binding protein n=1 Tax=Aurantimonas sp. VKM B-3413 TaxID=2779401 RepID=UPI001E37FF2D|nr:C4-dicarboxylate TRAP transporter substrate-binding protein [Aurantimonas sp. VKM B-3413]MCB8840407.1 C4-dicarboxylate TRAP transporter substrate-binding protein [Aurantimonas sp. VKM B-3413]